MRSNRKLRIVLGVTVCLASLVCLSTYLLSSSASLFDGTPPEVRANLLGHIPIGTPREVADRLVASIGMEVVPASELAVVDEEVIECRYMGARGLFDQTIWLVRIDCQNGKVADVICESVLLSYW